ncbi:MAG: hypothetical protein ACRYG7_10485, partial [Janthinobacterium lividum]
YLVRGRLPAGFAASMTGESYFLRVHFYPTTSGIQKKIGCFLGSSRQQPYAEMVTTKVYLAGKVDAE